MDRDRRAAPPDYHGGAWCSPNTTGATCGGTCKHDGRGTDRSVKQFEDLVVELDVGYDKLLRIRVVNDNGSVVPLDRHGRVWYNHSTMGTASGGTCNGRGSGEANKSGVFSLLVCAVVNVYVARRLGTGNERRKKRSIGRRGGRLWNLCLGEMVGVCG